MELHVATLGAVMAQLRDLLGIAEDLLEGIEARLRDIEESAETGGDPVLTPAPAVRAA